MSLLGTSLALPATAAHAATSAGTSPEAVNRDSHRCSNSARRYVNYSWGEGISSATVYFNNHCTVRQSAKLHFRDATGSNYTKCMKTNGGTKGKKRWDFGAGGRLVRITKGC
ncbi:hypothetical protein ACFQYP_12450 [Nonomuraea antimicrobica]